MALSTLASREKDCLCVLPTGYGKSLIYQLLPFVFDELQSDFEILKANEILSSSFKRENRLKLCQATWTTHSHSEKFNKMLKNFANFTRFSVLFSIKKVTGSSVKLSESIFKEFILCFQSYLCSFCTISSGLRVQFRHLLANIRKIYIHDVNIDASQADRALNWTARNQ